ncbi:MAG TPA: hypothetical protein VHQ47_07700 [Phycisphaerae bacterium]|jgi:hypothetical protein|nr:hypothetical protein [Phycisphaerae bacterium]
MKPMTQTQSAPRVLVDPFDAFLARLSRKSLASVQAHLEAAEGHDELGHGRQWKRLAAMLAKLAGHAIEASGQHVLRFYIADGKYRQQVFTLEDMRKGAIQVYLPDILDAALARKILIAPHEEDHTYAIGAAPTVRVEVERISSESKEVPEFCKPMLGWGRRALRIAVPATGDDILQQVIWELGQLAAEAWPKAAETAPAS